LEEVESNDFDDCDVLEIIGGNRVLQTTDNQIIVYNPQDTPNYGGAIARMAKKRWD
jgi:hypothetical protein